MLTSQVSSFLTTLSTTTCAIRQQTRNCSAPLSSQVRRSCRFRILAKWHSSCSATRMPSLCLIFPSSCTRSMTCKTCSSSKFSPFWALCLRLRATLSLWSGSMTLSSRSLSKWTATRRFLQQGTTATCSQKKMQQDSRVEISSKRPKICKSHSLTGPRGKWGSSCHRCRRLRTINSVCESFISISASYLIND